MAKRYKRKTPEDSGRGRKPKYSPKIVARILEMIELDTYSLKEICEEVRVGYDTFYQWKAEIPQFSEAVKNAEAKRDARLVVEARKSLKRLVEGYTVEESKTVYVSGVDSEGNPQPQVKEQTNTTKHFQPSPAAVFFTLCNKDGWTNNYSKSEVTGKEGEPLFQGVIIQKTYKDGEESGQD
jgi:transposase